jgi:hypothetical protein
MRVSTRHLTGFVLALGAVACFGSRVWATTLEQLTLDDMARKSTAIVRAKVSGSHAEKRGADVYTCYKLQVVETWKSSSTASAASAEVAVPGGIADGIRQSVSGAPELKSGQEYVLFLWTSRSGLTQVVGLSQGVFKVSEEGSGGGNAATVVQRPASSEPMLNRSGFPVDDHPVSMRLDELRARVRSALAAAKLGTSK